MSKKTAAAASAVVYDLRKPVSLHAWNADRTMCAVVHNDNNVIIYSNCNTGKAKDWTPKYTLTNHDQLVSGLDWSAAHNKILTCSHDRNAFVFTLDEATDKWVAGLVLLRLPRGCTGAYWSPDGDKLFVTSAFKEVRVCTYDEDNDWWWPPDDVKKADKSTALAAAWHPNSQIVATGSAKKVCRIFSAYIDDTDDAQDPGPFAEGEDFGVNIIDFDDCDGWVEGIAWSQDGYKLAFVSHDATVYVVTFAADGTSSPTIQNIRQKTRPHTRVLFLTNTAFVCTGHEMVPQIYSLDGSSGLWELSGDCDVKAAKAVEEATSRTSAARGVFASRAMLGNTGEKKTEEKHYKHRHSIADLRPYAATAGGAVTHFSTCCTGGKIVVWDATTLDMDMARLSLS